MENREMTNYERKSVIKSVAKRFIALLLVLFMFCGTLPTISFENGEWNVKHVDNPFLIKAEAASGNLSLSVANLGASYADGTVQSDHGGSAGWTARK